MTLAINTVDEHGLSNKAHCELHTSTAKGEQSNAMLAIHLSLKGIYQLYSTNKTEHFSFKSGYAVQIAKLIKEIGL